MPRKREMLSAAERTRQLLAEQTRFLIPTHCGSPVMLRLFT